jgi:hypothetical protein
MVSSFAGNGLLISPDCLIEEGLLDICSVSDQRGCRSHRKRTGALVISALLADAAATIAIGGSVRK